MMDESSRRSKKGKKRDDDRTRRRTADGGRGGDDDGRWSGREVGYISTLVVGLWEEFVLFISIGAAQAKYGMPIPVPHVGSPKLRQINAICSYAAATVIEIMMALLQRQT